MSQAILDAAKELIRNKRFAEARAILLTIPNDPTAAKWLLKLDERMGQPTPSALPSQTSTPSRSIERQGYTILPPTSNPSRSGQQFDPEDIARAQAIMEAHVNRVNPQTKRHENVGMARVFRWVWGILLLLSVLWLGLGFIGSAGVTSEQLSTAAARRSQAYQFGTVLGGGLSLTFFLCTGLPFFILFGLLYWRNGVAIREAKRHQQTVEAMRGR